VNALGQDSIFLIDEGSAALGGASYTGGGSWALRRIAMAVMKREPMGLGDVKFYTAAGFWLGLNPDAAALFLIVSGACSIVFFVDLEKENGRG